MIRDITTPSVDSSDLYLSYASSDMNTTSYRSIYYKYFAGAYTQLEKRVDNGSWEVWKEWDNRNSNSQNSTYSNYYPPAGTTKFQFRIRKGVNYNGNLIWSNYLEGPVVNCYTFTSPTGITYPSKIKYNQSHTVSWTAATGAVKYVLQCGYDGINFTTINNNITTTSYTISSLNAPDNTEYIYYRVYAVDSYGRNSPYNTGSKCDIYQINAPSSITYPSSVDKSDFVNISWSSISSIDNYILERKIDNGSWVIVYSGTSTSYKDQLPNSGSRVTYRVKAKKYIRTVF